MPNLNSIAPRQNLNNAGTAAYSSTSMTTHDTFEPAERWTLAAGQLIDTRQMSSFCGLTEFLQRPDADGGGHGDRESVKDFANIHQSKAANGLQVSSD